MGDNVPSHLSLTSSQQTEIEEFAQNLESPSGYRWIPLTQVPTLIPDRLRSKFVSALVMWERQSRGVTAIVCNGVRFDPKTNEYDEEPVGVAVYSSGASTGAIAIHHGNWSGRTTPVRIPPEGAALLGTTSLADYYPLARVPSNSSGPLSDLDRTSHEGAFKATMSVLFPEIT